MIKTVEIIQGEIRGMMKGLPKSGSLKERAAIAGKEVYDKMRRLTGGLSSRQFSSDNEEIGFYKEDLPEMLAQYYYWTKVSDFLIRVADISLNLVRSLLERERQEMRRFYADHDCFLEIYLRGDNRFDRRLYLQQAPLWWPYADVTDVPDGYVPTASKVISKYLAYQMYAGFLVSEEQAVSALTEGSVIPVARDSVSPREFDIDHVKAEIDGWDFERRRTALVLHDGISQELAAARLHLFAALDEKDKEATRARITEVLELLAGALVSVQKVCRDLHPSTLEDLGLVEALRELADAMTTGEVSMKVEALEDFPELPPRLALDLFRVAQALLSDALGDGKGKEVVIRVAANDTEVKMELLGLGKRFDFSGSEGNVPSGVLARVCSHHGALEWKERPGNPGSVYLAVPRKHSS